MFIAIDRPLNSANPLLEYLIDSSSGVVFPLYLILGTLVALSSLGRVCPVSTKIFCSNVYFAPRNGIQESLGFRIPGNWIPVFVSRTRILDSNL